MRSGGSRPAGLRPAARRAGAWQSKIQEPEGGKPGFAAGMDLFAQAAFQLDDPARRVGRLQRHFLHAAQEELQPPLPVPLRTHGQQSVIILLAVLLQVVAEVKQRPGKDAAPAQVKGDQQAADAAVAVQKGMDGLELGVDQGDLDQGRQAVPGVDEFFQVRDQCLDISGGRRHEDRFGQRCAGSADPILRSAVFARRLGLPPNSGEKNGWISRIKRDEKGKSFRRAKPWSMALT